MLCDLRSVAEHLHERYDRSEYKKRAYVVLQNPRDFSYSLNAGYYPKQLWTTVKYGCTQGDAYDYNIAITCID